MKVVIVHGRYRSVAPSGENHVVDQERAALEEAGHRVSTFEAHSDDIAGWPLHRRMGLPLRSIRNPDARRDLARHLEAERPDVVHVHNTFPLLSPSVLQACADVGVPAVATIHNYKLLCASGDFYRAGRPCHDCAGGLGAAAMVHGCYRGSRLASAPVVAGSIANRDVWRRLVSAYVFISGAQRDLLAPLDLPADRVFVKHNFVPEPGPVVRAPEQCVTYVGRLDAAKGVPLLMAAWDSFRGRNPDSALRLVIAGSGPLDEQVRSWAGGHPSVDVLGLVPREEVWSLLARSTAVVVPSQWEETFGLVAVEAMAASVAPIAPSAGSFPELIDHGVDGVLFDHGSADALAGAIADVDRCPQRLVEIGARGRTSYERRFTPQVSLERLLDIYRFAASHPVVAR